MNTSDIPPIPFEQLKQGVLPIIAVAEDAQWHPVGTAFVIAVIEPKTALLLTAAHNLQYIVKIDAPHTQHHRTVPPQFQAKPPSRIALARTETYVLVRNGTSTGLAKMVQSWCRIGFDVALMLAQIRQDDLNFTYRTTLDSRPIREGTPTMAVGYPHMRANFTSPPDYEKSDFQGELALPFTTRIGKVVSLHPQGVGICRWPGFRVNSPFDSGMSGGPVIDLSEAVPLVRGIVCADMSGPFDDGTTVEGRQGFSTMLWLAMTIETQITLFSEDGRLLIPKGSLLLDFVRHGVVNDHGQAYEHIRVNQTANGMTCSYSR